MATVTGYTAARMKEIEDKAIVGGEVVGGNLILRPKNYPTEPSINAGPVIGPAGPTGPAGAVSTEDLNTKVDDLEAELRLPLGVMNKKLQSTYPAGFQTIPSTTHTTINFPDADLWDNGAFHNLAVDDRKFTVPAGGAGIYQVTYNGYFTITGSPSGTRFISIVKNSLTDASGRIAAHQLDYGAAFGHTSICINDHFRLAAGDYLTFNAYQVTGATQAFTANVCMRWVSL